VTLTARYALHRSIVQRAQREAITEHEAHLRRPYTGGLFRNALCVDLFFHAVQWLGLAMVAGHYAALAVFALAVAHAALADVPRRRVTCRARYGAEYAAWEHRNRALIPWVW
jgi:hypothetical protein